MEFIKKRSPVLMVSPYLISAISRQQKIQGLCTLLIITIILKFSMEKKIFLNFILEAPITVLVHKIWF